jgi:hypothetical protein
MCKDKFTALNFKRLFVNQRGSSKHHKILPTKVSAKKIKFERIKRNNILLKCYFLTLLEKK